MSTSAQISDLPRPPCLDSSAFPYNLSLLFLFLLAKGNLKYARYFESIRFAAVCLQVVGTRRVRGLWQVESLISAAHLCVTDGPWPTKPVWVDVWL